MKTFFLFKLPTAVYLLAAFIAGLGLTLLFAPLLPAAGPLKPTNAILASFAVELLSLAALLACLRSAGFQPARDPNEQAGCLRYANLRAWLKSSAFSGLAFAGIAAAPCHHESLWIFFALWLLFVGQGALLAAAHSLLTLIFFPAPSLARPATLLLVCVLVTAPFWSKGPLLRTSQDENAPSHLPQIDWTGAVMKLSPIMAVSSAWYTESDAARAGASTDPARAAQAEGNRWDLVHGQLTYRVWLGSYLSSRYSFILPGSQDGVFSLGLALGLFLWGLPLLVFADWRLSN
jgi:hypothetical protein